MMHDRVAADDARQAENHDAVKSRVEQQVNHEIARQTSDASAGGTDQVAAVAHGLREQALAETVHGERTVVKARSAARISQFIDYGFGVIYGLLAIRLVLGLIAANSGSGFVQFIRTVSGPFYAPFRGIVPSPSAGGGYTLALPIIIAIVVWALLHAAVNGLLRMVGTRKTEI